MTVIGAINLLLGFGAAIFGMLGDERGSPFHWFPMQGGMLFGLGALTYLSGRWIILRDSWAPLTTLVAACGWIGTCLVLVAGNLDAFRRIESVGLGLLPILYWLVSLSVVLNRANRSEFDSEPGLSAAGEDPGLQLRRHPRQPDEGRTNSRRTA